MTESTDWIHRILDGDPEAVRPAAGTEEGKTLASYERAASLLAESRGSAPPGFDGRVMESLPEGPDASWSERLRDLWPARGRWLVPAVTGAVVAAMFLLTMGGLERFREADLVAVRFEVHAPRARQVELVGSFNGWSSGEILLVGPDPTGYWTVDVKLPAGRHEYLFLVDGRDWMTDPAAVAYRPDGFGRKNALIDL